MSKRDNQIITGVILLAVAFLIWYAAGLMIPICGGFLVLPISAIVAIIGIAKIAGF